MDRGAGVLGGEHLGEDAVAQAEGRVAKAGEAKGLQEFRKDHGSRDDNLGAARPDALDGAALGDRHLGEPDGQFAHLPGGGNCR